MRRIFLKNVISFLSGVLWATAALSAFFVFIGTLQTGIGYAIAMTVIDLLFWFFWIVIIEMANIQLEKLDELRKQTELLRSIDEKISHNRP